MNPIIGIDLGTTNSCVAVLQNGEPRVIANELGQRTTPSVVAFKADGTPLIGELAKRQAITNPKNTLNAIKRLIGRRFDSSVIANLRALVSFEIVRAPNGDAWVRAGERTMSPPEVSAHVLRAVKVAAESELGVPIVDAIVTVPAYFDDAQRQATKDAGEIAGLNVRALLNEPTAAALAYGVAKRTGPKTIAVFDLGGGTFDVSILRNEDGVLQVLATAGDTFLGGDDFDHALMRDLLDGFREREGVDLRDDAVVCQRLRAAVETAKHELTMVETTEVNLPFVGLGKSGPLHIVRAVTRERLESLSRSLIERIEAPCLRAIADAGLDKSAIEQILLVGGMTRMPSVHEAARAIFGKRPTKAANPDEIVALGAAVQGAIMRGDVKEMVLLDVTPHSLGIRVEGDRFSPIIRRNATIPARETKTFATTKPDQEHVLLEICQGDDASASNNRLLGQFILGDIPRGPAGSVHVEVSFTLDANGILDVDAVESGTRRRTSKRILASSGLLRQDVERLARAARGK
jgi:molecular chaperone DnaK